MFPSVHTCVLTNRVFIKMNLLLLVQNIHRSKKIVNVFFFYTQQDFTCVFTKNDFAAFGSKYPSIHKTIIQIFLKRLYEFRKSFVSTTTFQMCLQKNECTYTGDG